MNLVRRMAMLAVCSGIAILATSSPAKALLTAKISNGVSSVSITDNVMNDFNPAAQSLFFSGNVGAFSNALGSGVSLTASSNAPGSNDSMIGSFITDTTITVRNSTSGTQVLTVMLSDNAFTIPGLGTKSHVISSVSTTQLTGSGSAATNRSTVSGTMLAGTAMISGPSTNASNSVNGNVTITSSPYTISQTGTITLAAGQVATVTFTTTVIGSPEPASMVMLATALPVLGLVRRLRRARAAS